MTDPRPDRPHVALDVSAVPAQAAGAGVYVLRIVEALAAADSVQLDLVSRIDDVARWQALAPGAVVHPLAPKARPARLVWEQVMAPSVARRIGADLWHGPHYSMPLRAPGRRVVTVHDLTFFDHPEWHERSKVLYFRPMIRATAKRADLLVCVSRLTADRLLEVLEPQAPVRVVPLAVDHTRFRTDGGTATELSRLAELGVRPPFVVFVGTIEPRKNVPGLVRAFDRIADDHPDLQLVIAGRPGWGVDDVDEVITACRSRERVVRLGYVDDDIPPALYRHAAAAAYPSFEEGFGLPALEALACGAPLVTTMGSTMAEAVDQAALLVPPGDTDGLTEALAALVDDTDSVASRLRRLGPVTAAPYTWEACAAGHVAAYREVLGTGG